jgi:hypothetical protein
MYVPLRQAAAFPDWIAWMVKFIRSNFRVQNVLFHQDESVFRLRNFNIVGFSTFILLRYMFRS